MSSMICSAKHFNSTEKSTYELIIKPNFNELWFRKYCKNIDDLTLVEKTIKDIFSKIKYLNVLSWCTQYNQFENEVALWSHANKETSIFKLDNKGLYQALTCISYQIEEDRISITKSEKKALEFINDMKNAIARHLIKDIPSNNEWEVN